MAVRQIYHSTWRRPSGPPRTRVIPPPSVPDYHGALSVYMRKLPLMELASLADAANMDIRIDDGEKVGSEGYANAEPTGSEMAERIASHLSDRAEPGSADAGGSGSPGAGRGARALMDRRRSRGAYPGGQYTGGPAGPAGPGKGAGYPVDKANIEAYIREQAIKRGMDPDYAVKVFRGEGASAYEGDRDATGRPTSFGPYQLHYAGRGGGMSSSGEGERFTAETGLDARDPSTWKEQVQYALNRASKEGWGAWHGRPGGRSGPTRIGIAGSHPVPIDVSEEEEPTKEVYSGDTEVEASQAAAARGEPGSHVRQLQGRVAGIRRQQISDQLSGIIDSAAAQHGVIAEVTSGGQPPPGGGPRKGTTRHDVGGGRLGAADLRLRDAKTGRLLDMRKPEDATRMAQFMASAVAGGATGVGAGLGYMGPHTMHIGGGTPAHWGGAPWVGTARQAGVAGRTPTGAEIAAAAAAGGGWGAGGGGRGGRGAAINYAALRGRGGGRAGVQVASLAPVSYSRMAQPKASGAGGGRGGIEGVPPLVQNYIAAINPKYRKMALNAYQMSKSIYEKHISPKWRWMPGFGGFGPPGGFSGLARQQDTLPEYRQTVQTMIRRGRGAYPGAQRKK